MITKGEFEFRVVESLFFQSKSDEGLVRGSEMLILRSLLLCVGS